MRYIPKEIAVISRRSRIVGAAFIDDRELQALIGLGRAGTSTCIRSKIPSPSVSNSVSTQRSSRIHSFGFSKAGTFCAGPFSKMGPTCAWRLRKEEAATATARRWGCFMAYGGWPSRLPTKDRRITLPFGRVIPLGGPCKTTQNYLRLRRAGFCFSGLPLIKLTAPQKSKNPRLHRGFCVVLAEREALWKGIEP